MGHSDGGDCCCCWDDSDRVWTVTVPSGPVTSLGCDAEAPILMQLAQSGK